MAKEMMTTEDRLLILELISLYSFAWDSADADGFAELFTENAICTFFLNGAKTPTTKLSGKESFREAAITRAGYFKKIGLVTKHFMPNTVITPIEDGFASCRSQALITWQQVDKDPLPKAVQAGYYDSELIRTPSGWKFKSRQVYLNGKFSVKEVYGNAD
jgi:hypothetical protein